MSVMSKRKKYGEQFKAEAVELGTAAHFGDRLVRQLVRPAGS